MKDMATDVRDLAGSVAVSLEQVFDRFAAMPDKPGAQVHVLFARLYRCTTLCWLAALDEVEAPDLAYWAILRFYEAYQTGVLACRDAPMADVPRPWRKYHRLARRITMRAPMSLHIMLVSLGVRAHVRHDLGPAIHAAERDLAASGAQMPFRPAGAVLHGAHADRAFVTAIHAFVAIHGDHPSKWRRFWLAQCDKGLFALSPVWLGTFEGWRRASRNDARPDAY
ncbi:DUF5995 family protein [Maritimibacter sp. UBA3975]|mgnify:CR=1 FL=1|uniref:DUF5995 family protein n=1 Tax=Maritimibacter sp. UBA3975 TaxID=1946833 RepID=UPI000C0B338C|nr:DUF5995 family protein [Maritimibacter sp. UBA3975]MAM61479.1 hypothetical protein [Maritimibacter sp.]|tara:strand:- start:692 stop:1363 length:672 start_codon:yes stop_codon:yes gene_type:complete